MTQTRKGNLLKKRLIAVVPWMLAISTGAVLIFSLPDLAAFARTSGQVLVYGLLTTVALVFGILLTEGEFSVAHIVGMVGFLSLPASTRTSLTWAIFLGGVAGGGLLLARARAQPVSYRQPTKRLRSIIFVTARVTLSFYAAGQFYMLLGGSLPLRTQTEGATWNTLLTMIAYSLLYVMTYSAIFLLQVYSERRSIRRLVNNDLWQILVILFLPIPFAVLGAEFASQVTLPGFVILVTGLVLIILGLHALSRSEHRLRKQLDELRSLSVVTQAMRAHLNMDALLKTAYLQIAHLLDVSDFMVALTHVDEKELDFPLVIRHGEEQIIFDWEKASLRDDLLSYILQTQTPLLLTDDVAVQAQAIGCAPPRETVYSWLGVPLLAGGRLLGAMVVMSQDPHQHFGPDDLRLLNIIAASASIAIENAQLYRQQTERADQLAMLNNISSLLSGTLSPDSVLDALISSASVISKANAVAVYLFWDDTTGALTLARSAGLSDEFAAHPPRPLLAGKLNGQTADSIPAPQPPVVVADIAGNAEAGALSEIMRREGKSALIELPLEVGNNHLGIIGIYYNTPQTFAPENIELLRTFANQAAQAIHNARQYSRADEALERRVEQLFALAAIGRLLTATMDLHKIGDLVLGYATDGTKAPTGLVALRDESGSDLQIISQRGYPEHQKIDPTVIRQNLSGKVFEGGQAVRSGSVQQEPDYLPLLASTRSLLLVPILRGKDTVGVIRLESDQPDAFSEEDSYFVGQLANQTVIAVDNMRLFYRITEARDRLQVILDAMEEGLLLIDADGRIILANPRIDLLGLKSEQLVHRHVDELLNQRDLKLIERIGFPTADDLRELVNELRTRRWDDNETLSYGVQGEHGMLYIQRQIIPVRDENGEAIGLLLVFYNKTEEQELARTREELSQMIVHDLRSPLTAVTTSLKLLRELVPQDIDFRRIVETTTDASQRAIRKLLSRVDALLDISRMESGQLTLDTEPTELATLADSVCVELSPLAHELEVQVISQISDDLPLLNIDPDKVERVLLNLVDNALKYSPAESSITLRAHKPGSAGAPENFVRIEVIDKGPGIPDDYKERLFDRYVQIDGRRKVRRGVGLGLTFCKMVAEAHGGRIWIEDNPGGGSIFTLTLPVAQVAVASAEQDKK